MSLYEVSRLVALWQKEFDEGQDKSIEHILANHPKLAEFFDRHSEAINLVRERIERRRNCNVHDGPSSTLTLWRADYEPVSGYRLVERLGCGGSGEVWHAIAPGGRPVAMKRVYLNRSLGQKERDSLNRFRSMSSHVHVLEIHGFWELTDELVIASTLADSTLKDELNRAPNGLPLFDLRRFMLEAADGLDHLNQSGIQHRDIKPANLLLVANSVVIGDFGLLKMMSGSVVSHSGAGTPRYMPPEARGGRLAASSDQYSLARTYYELRTGSLNDVVVLENHDFSATEALGLRRALDADPAKRFESCREFVRALRIGETEPYSLQDERHDAVNRVFVSCAQEDRPLVHGLVQILRTLGLTAFDEVDSIPLGKPRVPAIDQLIRDASVVLIFWCVHAQYSSDVEHASKLSALLQKDIVPVLLDSTPLNEELEGLQYVDLQPLLTNHDRDRDRLGYDLEINERYSSYAMQKAADRVLDVLRQLVHRELQ